MKLPFFKTPVKGPRIDTPHGKITLHVPAGYRRVRSGRIKIGDKICLSKESGRYKPPTFQWWDAHTVAFNDRYVDMPNVSDFPYVIRKK